MDWELTVEQTTENSTEAEETVTAVPQLGMWGPWGWGATNHQDDGTSRIQHLADAVLI